MIARPEDETRNVLISTVLIGAVVMAFSITILWTVTNDIYLDAYYTIETFFGAANTAASFDLADLAFAANPYKFTEIVGIVILDNLSNIIVVSFVIAAVLDIIKYTNLEEIINKFKAGRLKNHVIICEYNEMSENLIDKLVKNKVGVVVIAKNNDAEEALSRKRVPLIIGKFTEEEILKNAGILSAHDVIFASGSDIDNLVGSITAKKLSEKVKIIVRVTNDDIRNKMYRVGVDMCVLPEYLAGIEIGEKLARIMK